MEIRAVLEYNQDGSLLWAENVPGASSRGATPEEAEGKLPAEVRRFLRWRDGSAPEQDFSVRVARKKESSLDIRDADSDLLLDSEQNPMTWEEYAGLKALVLRSAGDFQRLYDAVPDKHRTGLPGRKTFYGEIPRTAEEMYRHTNGVSNYYIGELGTAFENLPDILENRALALQMAESLPDFLQNRATAGSFGELWSLKKALRRFLWHDRIHAQALWRMAGRIWPDIPDPFCFGGTD